MAQLRLSRPAAAILLAVLFVADCSRPAHFNLGRSVGRGGVYEHVGAGDVGQIAAAALPRVYVPNLGSGTVTVIDPATLAVVDQYRVGDNPQHVVPSWDLRTLWVTGSEGRRGKPGSLTAIDPMTGKVTRTIKVPDAYNMYFSPDGKSAIVVAESRRQLEFRDPQTMALQTVLDVPGCPGLNHADYAGDYSYAIFTCEFSGALAKIDVTHHRVLGYLKLTGRQMMRDNRNVAGMPHDGRSHDSMPQDIRVAPDGKTFYVANMMTDGVHVIDGDAFTETGFIPTGIGAHGLYPSRDGKILFVANRGSNLVAGPPKGPGSVSVIDFATQKVLTTWPIPGGGSPDMGNVSADGGHLWLSGRFDDVVYCIDTRTGAMTIIPVGHTPHGLAIWPQPGKHSLGHTGVMR